MGEEGLRHGVDHPPPSSAKVKEKAEIYLHELALEEALDLS
jgi:hypothetical protein